MGVDADEQRSGDAVRRPVQTDCLSDREDMVLVERIVERRAAMAGGAERNLLRRVFRFGLAVEIGCDETRHVHEMSRVDGIAG